MKSPIIFARVDDMKYYQGCIPDDLPFGGGRYRDSWNETLEYLNFCPQMEEGSGKSHLFGYVQKNGCTGSDRDIVLPLERMAEAACSSAAVSAEGVTVVFCSRAAGEKNLRVVGFYKNATVFRHTQWVDVTGKKGTIALPYSFWTEGKNGVLLPVHTRFSDSAWFVPTSGKDGFHYGFGRSNIWYAGKNGCSLEERQYAEAMEDKIFSYAGENWTGKQVQA